MSTPSENSMYTGSDYTTTSSFLYCAPAGDDGSFSARTSSDGGSGIVGFSPFVPNLKTGMVPSIPIPDRYGEPTISKAIPLQDDGKGPGLEDSLIDLDKEFEECMEQLDKKVPLPLDVDDDCHENCPQCGKECIAGHRHEGPHV